MATPSGHVSVQQLLELIDQGEIDTVIFAMIDMQGRLLGKRMTGAHFRDHAIHHGVHVCTYLLGTDMEMETPAGFELMSWESGYGDYLLKPDWGTLRVIPWLEKTALAIGDTFDEEAETLVPVAPRAILQRLIERFRERGFLPMLASELEYYVLRQTYQELQQRGFADPEPFGWYNEDYHLLQGTKAEPLHRALRNQMTAAGIPVEFSKGEAAPGQHEVNIHFAEALESADRAALFKHGAKEIAYQQGLAVTFMAKPHHAWTGSSGHIHVSLWSLDRSENRFSIDSDSREMSETMRWFLGGLMAVTPDFALFFAPNINSYKRYASASWAPVNVVWGRDNRTCGYRIVGHGTSLRIENRFPGGDANPYLAYAALLAAGLHGIDQRIEPPPAYQGNGYLATGVPRIPVSLVEATHAWQQSPVVTEALGEVVARHYANAARVEQLAMDQTVTSWERVRYLERS